MKYCVKCVQPDTRPSLVFNQYGECAACVNHENRKYVDWDKRWGELEQIASWAKQNSTGFDCVCGVSGGKDSLRQALTLRDQLGLRVLLVNCYPDGITEVGKQNLENLVQKGFDMISYRCNPTIVRETCKMSFYKYGNPVKPSEYPLYAVTYQTALTHHIPLIVEGDNPAIIQGVVKDLEPDGNAMHVNRLRTLAGGNAKDWLYEGISLNDLSFYQFPEQQLQKALLHGQPLQAIFLGYYVKDWGHSNNTFWSLLRGLRPRPDHDPERCGRLNPYGSIDSDMQILNQMLKYLKFGFGFVTDEVCHYIRMGIMTRDEAIELAEKYDGKCSQRYIDEFCSYIGIDNEEFWRVAAQWVNRDLFSVGYGGLYVPKFQVGVGLC